MISSYMLVYSAHFTRDQVKDFLERQPAVVNWHTCLPNSFFVVSTVNSESLARLFREHTGERGAFVFVGIKVDSNGFLPKESWAFISNPRPLDPGGPAKPLDQPPPE